MANKMLIDAAHPEETRVVVLRGNRVEEFDFETAQRKQLRGNIYLAKVTRVEPSLQAAFVEYGGNRHGFLAFSEIHPDYYQIPVADRQALIDADARAERDYDNEEEEQTGGRGRGRRRGRDHRRRRDQDDTLRSEPVNGEGQLSVEEIPHDATELPIGDGTTGDPLPETSSKPASEPHHHDGRSAEPQPAAEAVHAPEPMTAETANPPVPAEVASDTVTPAEPHEAHAESDAAAATGEHALSADDGSAPAAAHDEHDGNGHDEEEEVVESVGGADAMEEVPDRAPRYHRRPYKIQEVIKRRQVMLVQVVKEERGTKGAALTTYLSLAGRYCVLMPNTARGGGISRKITSAEDRKKLREIAEELDVPEGMGVILRTAGAARTKQEVKRDFEYLLRIWEQVRDLTLKSSAPTLVYEEGSLAKRSIRDLYTKDIEEIIVAGETGYRDAKEFMRMLMPSHAKNVKLYADTQQPVFTRYGIESQLDAMFSPTVQLKSGGYIVINQTEALVSIDVNSGRSTREHHIEDTALKTNCEAAEEVARQLRLRDLAGLIVIDFIDMDEKRNNRTVERRMKDALRNDRARIQVGRISHFGLLEMSRQRIRTSVLESSTDKCPHCGGTGHMRSVSSVALQLLRGLEETLLKAGTHNQIVRTRPEIALYVLNHKRAHLMALEQRFHVSIAITSDATIGGQPGFTIDRGEQVMTPDQAKAIAAQALASAPPQLIEEEEPDTIEEDVEETAEEHGESAETAERTEHADQPHDFAGDESQPMGEPRGRRRRRRGRGRGGEPRREPHGEQPPFAAGHGEVTPGETPPLSDDQPDFAHAGEPGEGGFAPQPHGGDPNGNGEARHRRRGRRGGRRNRRGREGAPLHGNGSDQPHGEFQGGEIGQQDFGQQPNAGHAASTPQHEPAFSSAPEPSYSPRPEPVPAPSAPPAPEPRRRSTVREPAPVLGESAAAPVPMPTSQPAPEPAPTVTSAGDDAGKPRKTGWWAKRLLGGDKS
jgi:ribonuclease E